MLLCSVCTLSYNRRTYSAVHDAHDWRDLIRQEVCMQRVDDRDASTDSGLKIKAEESQQEK